MIRLCFAALTAIAISACATSTPYAPAESGRGYGFAEQKIEENRYRITFRGNSLTTRETVETFLLYRAAELTLQNGYDYFVVVEGDTEANTTYSRSANPAFFGRYGYGFGPYGYPGYAFPYYAYGFGWGSPYDTYTREIIRYSAVAFVSMHRGEKPDANPQAFDAKDVVDNLRASVLEAPPAS